MIMIINMIVNMMMMILINMIIIVILMIMDNIIINLTWHQLSPTIIIVVNMIIIIVPKIKPGTNHHYCHNFRNSNLAPIIISVLIAIPTWHQSGSLKSSLDLGFPLFVPCLPSTNLFDIVIIVIITPFKTIIVIINHSLQNHHFSHLKPWGKGSRDICLRFQLIARDERNSVKRNPLSRNFLERNRISRSFVM